MNKPIISTITNSMATIIVIRNPITRQWLFNLTLSRSITMKKLLGMAVIIISAMLTACQSPTSPAIVYPADPKINLVSLTYIKTQTQFFACWYPSSLDPQKDSIRIDSKRYTVSTRSRYRVETLPSDYLDARAGGDVIPGDWAIYRDTKTDSIYIMTDCISREMVK